MSQKLKNYILTQTFVSPVVTATGQPHRPTKIEGKRFTKGQIVKGLMQYANGAPSHILLGGTIMIPATHLREVETKELSNASGPTTKSLLTNTMETETPSAPANKKAPENPKVKYLDALLIGGIVGFVAIIVAEKQGWITEPDKKYRLYGAAGGAVLACYVIYRNKEKNKITVKK